MSSDSPVFHDPDGRRWRRVKRTYFFLAVSVTALAAVFIASVLANPVLPSFNLRQLDLLPRASDIKPKAPNLPANPSEQKAKKAQAELQRELAKIKHIVPGKRRNQLAIVPPPTILPTPISPTSRPLSIGFYINWDDSSYESLKRNINQLDWVIPAWIRLQDTDATNTNPIASDLPNGIDALNLIRTTRPQITILPMVQNIGDEKFDGAMLARAISDEPHRQQLISGLLSFVQSNKFGGVCIDFEEPPVSAQSNLLKFMQELHTTFQSNGLLVAQALPYADTSWNYKAFNAATDYSILMAYDQHWAGKEAGPVAAQPWFEQTL
jgi:hypothetical protein